MAINARETFLQVEQLFADLVATQVSFAETEIDDKLQRLSTPEKFISGAEVNLNVFLTDEQVQRLTPEGVKILLDHVTDGVLNLYREQGWTVCLANAPKWTSDPKDHWVLSMLFQFIPK